MADITDITMPLPADVPEDWSIGQVVTPNGLEGGLTEQHGFNYLAKQINDTQTVCNDMHEQLSEGVLGLEHNVSPTAHQDIRTELATKANTASPALTGTPTAPTAGAGTNNTQIATTGFVTAAVSPKANLASPAFSGTPTAPSPGANLNNTQIATTATVRSALGMQYVASMEFGQQAASPNTFIDFHAPGTSGNTADWDGRILVSRPTNVAGQGRMDISAPQGINLQSVSYAPTAAAGTNNTQIATTAFTHTTTNNAVQNAKTFKKITGSLSNTNWTNAGGYWYQNTGHTVPSGYDGETMGLFMYPESLSYCINSRFVSVYNVGGTVYAACGAVPSGPIVMVITFYQVRTV